MNEPPYEDAVGFVHALDHEGEKVTSPNLAQAMEISNKDASKCLKRFVRQGWLVKLGGDPVAYRPKKNPLTEQYGTAEES